MKATLTARDLSLQKIDLMRASEPNLEAKMTFKLSLEGTLDRGVTWQQFMTGMPTVPVHDLKVHPRDRELIAGTHGRSVWIVNVAPLQQLADSLMRRPVNVYAMATAYQYNQPRSGGL